MVTTNLAARLTLILWACLLGMAAASRCASADTADAQPSVLVQTASMRRGSVPRTVIAYGTVQATPAAHITLTAPLAGTVERLYVRVGETLANAAPLLQLVPGPQAASAYAQAVSTLQVATGSLRHTRTLLSEHLATQQQLADAQKAVSDARAELAALQAQGASGPQILRAPARSIVTAVNVSTHALVPEGASLLDLVRPDGLVLLLGVVPEEARTIMTGDKATVTAAGGTGTYAATVSFRGSIVDGATGLVPVQLPLPANALLPGETAQASITTGTVQGYVVPRQAVLVNDQGEDYIVQDLQGVARIVRVRVLGTQDDTAAIDGPIQSQAPVVLTGNYQARDGMKLRLAAGPDDRHS